MIFNSRLMMVPTAYRGESWVLPPYVEVDPAAKLVVANSKLITSALTSIVDSYIYRDWGAGYWSGTLTDLFDLRITANAANAAQVCYGGWANGVGSLYQVPDSLSVMCSSASWGRGIYLAEYAGGAFYLSASVVGIALNTTYYFTLKRFPPSVPIFPSGYAIVSIYNDANRTSLRASLTVALHSTPAYRYSYPIRSVNNAAANSQFGTISNQFLTKA